MNSSSISENAFGPWDANVGDFPRMDGERGDSARIRRAVEAAGAGGVVYFPRGEYEIDEMLVVDNSCSLLLHKKGALLVSGGRFSKNSPNSTLYTSGPEAGQLLWRDNRVLGFADAEKQALTKKLAGENADSAVAQHLAG